MMNATKAVPGPDAQSGSELLDSTRGHGHGHGSDSSDGEESLLDLRRSRPTAWQCENLADLSRLTKSFAEIRITINGITPRKPEEPWPIIPGRILSEIFCCGKIGDGKDEALKTAMVTPLIACGWGVLTKAFLLALRDYDHMYWTETWHKRDISEIFQESYFSTVILMGVTCCTILVCNYSHYKLNQLFGYVYYSKTTEKFMAYLGNGVVSISPTCCVLSDVSQTSHYTLSV